MRPPRWGAAAAALVGIATIGGCGTAHAERIDVPARAVGGTRDTLTSTGLRTLYPAPTLPPSTARGPAAPSEGTFISDPTNLAPAPHRVDAGGAPAFVPQFLVLPSGRLAPVDGAGIAEDGSLVVPPDPARVGWWTGGAEAGDPYGSVVLAGHIDSRRYGIGVLAELVQAKPGQLLVIRSTTRSLRYRISVIRQISKASLRSETDVFSQEVSPRLVLVTCGGRYNPVKHEYDDNLVVIAMPA